MRMPQLRTVLASAALAVAVTGLAALPAANASAAPATNVAQRTNAVQQGTLTSVVSGTFTDASGRAGTFTGTFTPSRFTAVGNQLQAAGLLTGQLVNADGTAQSVSQNQTFVVNDISASAGCQILDLNLAPLDLNLLGLVVHLDRVHLNITAVPGAGNLLGNLLCAVAGLFDGSGLLSQISLLLNGILALLHL
jgi:hypothetical protein